MSFVLFDRIRLFMKRGGIFGHENLLQNQVDLGKIHSATGDVDLSDPTMLMDQANVQLNRMERMKDFDQMDEVGEISLALDLYADESSLRDPERNHSVFVKTTNITLKNEIEDLLYETLNIDAHIRPIVRYLCKFGDNAQEIVPTANRDGVASIRNIQMYNFNRVETKYGDLVGFYYQEDGKEPVFMHPWQVSHMRLLSYERLFVPYGRSILDGARRDFRRLRLMEDAALVYRLTRSAEKRVFNVPVGNLPPKERDQYIEMISRRFKKHKFIDPATGAINERYAPHIQDDDYWVPVTQEGSQIKIDSLKGAENLDSIADIEYFKKKMIAALKIPFHRVGIGESAGDPGKSIASQSPEFSKAVQWVQDQVLVGIKKIVLVHLVLRGYDISDLKNFELGMTSASAIDELYRIETWKSRVDIMSDLLDMKILPEEWIISRFTDLTEDEYKIYKYAKIKQDEGKKIDEDIDRLGRLVVERERDDLLLKLKSSMPKNLASYQKMLNESEFDGLVDENYMNEDKEKAKSEMKVILESKDEC